MCKLLNIYLCGFKMCTLRAKERTKRFANTLQGYRVSPWGGAELTRAILLQSKTQQHQPPNYKYNV